MLTRILVNHVGFLPDGAKHCVVLDPPENEFFVIKGGVAAYRGRLRQVNAELGDGWVGDFSSVREEGIYGIRCGNLSSRWIVVSRDVYDQALRVMFNYFPTQRCGDSLTGWHAPCHMQDARRADTGEHVDLVGGWHQSGDLRKWMFGTPFGLVGLSQMGMIRNPRWDIGQIADELRWGNRYFQNMIRPDGGLMDHIVWPVTWGERNVYPNDPPTCATHLMIIGQALTGRYFADRDSGYSRTCLDAARRLWNYINGPSRPPGPYKPAICPPGHAWLKGAFDEHYPGSALERGDALYSALKLYEATRDASFLEQAGLIANYLVSLQVSGNIETDPSAACFRIGPGRTDLTAASTFGALGLAELPILLPEHPDAPRWKHAAELIAEQKCRMAERNPWGLIPSYWHADEPGMGRVDGKGRYHYFFRYQSRDNTGTELRAGPNGDITGGALFLLRAYRLTGEARCLTTACRQLDWILGCNLFDASTVEGVGLNQPPRFLGDDFFPFTPQIPGGAMTGIQGDSDDNPVPFGNNCSTEYDLPIVALLMWLLSEMTSLHLQT